MTEIAYYVVQNRSPHVARQGSLLTLEQYLAWGADFDALPVGVPHDPSAIATYFFGDGLRQDAGREVATLPVVLGPERPPVVNYLLRFGVDRSFGHRPSGRVRVAPARAARPPFVRFDSSFVDLDLGTRPQDRTGVTVRGRLRLRALPPPCVALVGVSGTFDGLVLLHAALAQGPDGDN